MMLLGLCLTLWRLPAVIDALESTHEAGGSPTQSFVAAMSAATGMKMPGAIAGTEEEASSSESSSQPSIIAAGGKSLTDAQRARLLRQAHALAPLPLDGSARKQTSTQKSNSQKKADPTAPAAPTDDLQKQLQQALQALTHN